VLFPAWNWRLRYNMLFIAGLLGAALIVLKPGLVATFLSLFGGAGEDNSVLYRTMDYPMAFEYVRQAPLFGRGTGTYVIPQYEVLDNQWLMYLITNGIVGVGLFAAMHLTGVVIALRAARRAANAEIRHLCTAFAATQVVAMAVAATYDSMYFMSFASLVSLTLGLCGVVWRLTHPDVTVRTAAPRWFASDGTSTFLRQYIRPERHAR
jgi:O-antigen ligase